MGQRIPRPEPQNRIRLLNGSIPRVSNCAENCGITHRRQKLAPKAGALACDQRTSGSIRITKLGSAQGRPELT